MKKLALALALALVVAGLSIPSLAFAADKAPRGEEARIDFPARNGIWNFYAPSDEVVYLQDRSRRWYRAELATICRGLKFAHAIGYDTRGSLSFDRTSAIIVEGERCPLYSLTRSEKPERRSRKKARLAS